MTPTNPPSVPAIDVEACVRLLTKAATDLSARAASLRVASGFHAETGDADRAEDAAANALKRETGAAQLSALASALPGMAAKAASWEASQFPNVSAARAAQPQETSADAEETNHSPEPTP